ncbi:DNA-binding transcriptional regulator, AcrR family [Streptomyces sp. 3213]|uniref:TetR/AcrR family transcriptional regulator n=1 Tax=Streptomyces sp. 3213.3 TaxID=1855348 RepID=UPI000895C577|nr:TetR/AcrR family transcriptional regulator [Streptomyces sp. 3213.3]SED19783.1 DNA-binding transcriptional regulator, AcrR family [Streptomyces sp. 3213] [Streptomyces sp. 3213.3]
MTQVRPMRADARRNYERLLKVAAEAFAEHGENASLDDIAKRAGVGSGTLYRHFPTRQALLEAAYVDRIEALGTRADELAKERPPGEALAEWLYEVCVGTIQVRGMKALLGSAVSDGTNVTLTVCGTHMKSAAERLVEAAQQEGTLRKDIEPIEVLRLAHGVSTASELANGQGKHIRRYLSLLTDGLRPAAQGE